MAQRFMAWAPSHGGPCYFGTKMTRELKSETLDPSRMDPAMAGLPHRTAELLVMKNLARRDQARLSLTDQGRTALHSLLAAVDEKAATVATRVPVSALPCHPHSPLRAS
jgi:hypothetical protein